MENSDLSLSPSDKRTLQHRLQGELQVSELDWVALQRLKRLRLAEDRGRVTVVTKRAGARCDVSNRSTEGHHDSSRPRCRRLAERQ